MTSLIILLNNSTFLADTKATMFWKNNKKERFDEIPEAPIELDVAQEFPQMPESEMSMDIPFPEEALDEKKDIPNFIVQEKSTTANKALEDKIASLKEENDTLKKHLNSYKDKNEKIQISLNNLKEENLKFKQDLSNREGNEKVIFNSDLDKAKLTNEKYQELAKTHEELKAKIRHDIRKIRLRETELSNRIELIKQDRDTLISAKDQKILKLKKQIEELEFQKQTVDEKVISLTRESKENAEKAERVIKALRLSTSLLESDEK